MSIQTKNSILSILLFCFATSLLFATVYKTTGLHLYFWDDPYIHLAVAESIYNNGYPSADGYSTSMASSSPLWTLLLVISFTITDLLGITDYMMVAPFVFNVLFGIASLIVASKIVSQKVKFVPFLMLLTAPLPIIVFVGMEHMMQIFIVTSLVYLSIKYIEEKNKKYLMLFLPVMFFAAFTRYELSIFSFAIFFFTIFDKPEFSKTFIQNIIQNKKIISMGILAIATPIVITGLYLKYHGLFFLPDSVIAKSVSNGPGFIENIKRSLSIYFSIKSVLLPLLFPIITSLFVFFIHHMKNTRMVTAPMAYAFGFMGLFHLLFAGPAFLRYDAYISAFSLIPIIELVLITKERSACKLGAYFLAFFFIVAGTLLLTRTVLGSYGVVIGTKNIFDQQIQTANFINSIKDKQTVALNDLGAVAFFTDAKIIDMVGLGTHEIAKITKEREPTGEDLKNQIKKNNVDWAIYYPNWFPKEQSAIREVCQPVGALKLKRNFICGGNVVVYDYCGKNLNKAKEDFKAFTKDISKITENRVEVLKTP